nr:hypothetical protein [Tanacetum cinerariifolium]
MGFVVASWLGCLLGRSLGCWRLAQLAVPSAADRAF